MKRVSVSLSDLKPNPYKKFIQSGEIDDAVVSQIMESAERTSFWEQWVVREAASGYQLAFGHNRLAAAKKLLGSDAKVSVQVEDYSDAQMYVAMADENAGDEEKTANQVDVVRKAQQLLVSNPSWCKEIVDSGPTRTRIKTESNPKGSGAPHEHGSVSCILAFLGENNWSHTKVVNLLKLCGKADESVLAATVRLKDRCEEGQISLKGAMALADLSVHAQRVAVEVIQTSQVAIPADAIKDAVEQVEAMPPGRQEAGIKRALRRKAEIQKGLEAERKRKQQNKGKPKSKREAPDVAIILENLAMQIVGITSNLKELLPFKEAIRGNNSFRNLEKKLLLLAAVVEEIGSKTNSPARAASEECKQLNQ